MVLATRNHTVGNTTFWTIDYSQWLEHGVTIQGYAATCDDVSVTIGTAFVSDGHKVKFSIAGGTLNQAFTVSLVMTDTKGGVKNDTVVFNVVAP